MPKETDIQTAKGLLNISFYVFVLNARRFELRQLQSKIQLRRYQNSGH